MPTTYLLHAKGPNGDYDTFCRSNDAGIIWDPQFFLNHLTLPGESQKDIYPFQFCKECLESPDMALLLLQHQNDLDND